MKLLRKTALLDDETVKSNIANNNGDANVEELTNVGHQFHFVYSPVLRIQKAWRSYKDNKLTTNSKVTPEPDFQSLHFSINPKNKLSHQLNIENNNFEFCCEMSNNIVGKSNTKVSAFFPNKFKIEPDSDSATSDYSDAIETSTDIHLINKQDLYLNNNLSSQIPLQKSQDEDEADFQKRVRKINLLSLAQEFAALKKMNSDALPFDLHQDKYKEASSMSDTASEADEFSHDWKREPMANGFSLVDINNGNSQVARTQDIHSSCCNVPDIVKVGGAMNEDDDGKHDASQRARGGEINDKSDGLPIMIINDDGQDHVPGENPHVQLIPEHGSKQWVGNREEIRKKLAFYEDEDLDSGENLSGLCFVNEVANDIENVKSKAEVSTARPDIIPPPRRDVSVVSGNEDFFTKQARLQTEAKMALAQVRPMAHMQLQLEKQRITKSPLADIVGMPGYGDGMFKKLTQTLMSHMNVAQLQVVVNDLHARIESLNDELMQQLVARDDLHMAQDAMLVDIEDLTGRAREFATRVNKRRESDKYV